MPLKMIWPCPQSPHLSRVRSRGPTQRGFLSSVRGFLASVCRSQMRCSLTETSLPVLLYFSFCLHISSHKCLFLSPNFTPALHSHVTIIQMSKRWLCTDLYYSSSSGHLQEVSLFKIPTALKITQRFLKPSKGHLLSSSDGWLIFLIPSALLATS